LLEAGLEVFAARGYEASAMEAIAARAGVSKPILYDHFDSKRELYTAVLAEQVSLLRRQVLPASDPARGTLEQRFRNSALAALGFAREHPQSWRLLFQEPVGDRQIVRAFSGMRAAATEAVAAEIAASGLKAQREIDARLAVQALAAMLMAAIESLGDQALAHPAVDLDELVELFMDLTWTGVHRMGMERQALV
jgi:AcrR family transcriptional regulator